MNKTSLVATAFTCFLALLVIALGAYTRLTDAGLGCPDWPGCYGYWTVPMTEEAKLIAAERYPEQALEPQKAWNEMVHRYLASALGAMIFLLSAVLWKRGTQFQKHLCGMLMVLVLFQGFLGMLTVTMALMPVVVMGHLLGGFSIFSLLALLLFTVYRHRYSSSSQCTQAQVLSNSMQTDEQSRGFFIQKYTQSLQANGLSVGIILLVMQIGLGGWTSANYAALSCVEFPICHQGWQQGFSVTQALAVPESEGSYEFGVKSADARMSIHVMHRIGAAAVLSWFLLLLGESAYTRRRFRQNPRKQYIHNETLQADRAFRILVAVLLVAQAALGISNVWFLLPIGVAVLHNLVACLLLAACVCWRFVLHLGEVELLKNHRIAINRFTRQEELC